MRRRLVILLTIFAMCLTSTVAQNKGPEILRKEFQKFVIEQAKLTEKEAAKFFPIYNECQIKKQALNSRIWKLRKDAIGKQLTEKEYQYILEEIAKLKIQIAELDKTYLELYHKVLSYKKIFDVQGAESRFHRELLKGVTHRHNNKKGK